ncbi:hypothetical protein CC78DRAFT_576823 [Lojkania enalia]|uniref:Uncharacterized protein n=1 Tax=Lojkania enalia TaxID=147567 RepID=A0A9P4KGZ1_9PLEO|nr:hypothetical protein CC78DRAFT_576823 [Didymosphaeria enalia]
MFYAAASIVPTVTLPSKQQVNIAIDAITDPVCDAMSKLLFRHSVPDEFLETELQGSKWEFADFVSEARKAPSRQGISRSYDILASRDNLEWQVRLNKTLVLAMKSVWIRIRGNRVWRLVLEIDVREIAEVDDVLKLMETGFELPEKEDWVSIFDYT